MKKVEQNFNPKVSIVIPVYNGSNYMREAIDSALAQTFKNIEIIVVNDGSTDNTEEIAKSYGDKIRYYKKENGGTSTALNVGIKNMQGQYFSWLSHDDMYYPNKIERQIEELNKLKDRNTIMMSDLDGINEKYEKIYNTNYISHIEQYPLREKSNIHPVIYNQTHGCTLLIPRVCFDVVGLFDESQLVAQDFEFFYRAFLKYPHKLISEVLVTARDSSNRQGIRSKNRGNVEYSELFISIIKNLTNEDIRLLAPNKLTFYNDMSTFFESAGYTIALEFIRKKMMKNIQISSHDLIGNKFNGYDLHLDLQEKGIDSKQLVLHKESNCQSVHSYNFEDRDATKKLLQEKFFVESDLVNLHLIHNIVDLNYLPIITKLKPTILSMHDPFFLGGHCVHHFDCKKWQTHCGDCPYLKEEFVLEKDTSALNFVLKKQAVENSQISVIVASEWMKKKVFQSPIWKDKKVYLLPFGVDQELFKPVGDTQLVRRKLKIPQNDFVIMFRADSGSFKGLDIIKKALIKLGNSKRKITLITVGQKGLLRDFHKKFNILEYGWIKDDELLVKLYQSCDIFLMPSRQETFGMMAIEAMSCGKMVLALDCNGSALSDVIDSPNCGMVVKEHEFSNKLQELFNDRGQIANRGKKSLKYAQKNYNKDTYIDKMIKIYEEVISSHQMDKDTKFLLNQLSKYSDHKDSRISLEKIAPPPTSDSWKHKFMVLFFKYKNIFPKSIRVFIKGLFVKK